MIPSIVGNPTYNTISEINLKINSNSASVQSNLGCGTLGLLQLTVSPAIYNTFSVATFVVPTNPVSAPDIESNSTGAQITELLYAFDTATALFNEYDHTDKALQKILLTTVDEIFIRSLRHKYVGYGLATTRTILDHLYITYANISSADLQENDAVFCTPYNINQPIETLFDRIEICGDYVAAGNTPYSLEQVLGIAFQLVYQTGLFVDDCKAWKSLPVQQKTWTDFKNFFATANNEWREPQNTTTGAEFHSVNLLQEEDTTQLYQQENVDTIANLDTSTDSNQATVATLTATNSNLTSALTACQLQLVEAL